MSEQTPKHHELMEKVASIILAGGQGTRLFPLTQNRCKPAVCFGGRYRLIDIPLSNSINARIHSIYVISQFFVTSLNQHILETYDSEFFRTSTIHLLSPEQTPVRKLWFKGTADAVRQNIKYLEASTADYYLILSGDQLYNMNFAEMVHFAKKEDVDLVIASIPVEEKEARRMGLLKIDNISHIVDFTEKPTDPVILKKYELTPEFLKGHHIVHPTEPHYLASMGIYVFKRKALLELLKTQGDDFGKDLIPQQVKKGSTSAFVYKGYWEDIGTISSFFEANLALVEQTHCLNIYDKANPIFTHPHNLPSPMIKETTQVTNSVISQGSIIEAKEITRSILGIRTCVKKDAILRNTIVLGNLSYLASSDNCLIGESALLDHVILDENTQIGNRVELTNKQKLTTFDGDGIYIRDGIIIVTSGTKIPDGYTL